MCLLHKLIDKWMLSSGEEFLKGYRKMIWSWLLKIKTKVILVDFYIFNKKCLSQIFSCLSLLSLYKLKWWKSFYSCFSYIWMKLRLFLTRRQSLLIFLCMSPTVCFILLWWKRLKHSAKLINFECSRSRKVLQQSIAWDELKVFIHQLRKPWQPLWKLF